MVCCSLVPLRARSVPPHLSVEAGFAPGARRAPTLRSMHGDAFRQSQHRRICSLSCGIPLYLISLNVFH